jgi:hypothetical protein
MANCNFRGAKVKEHKIKSYLFFRFVKNKTYICTKLNIMAKKKEWQEGEMIVAFNLTKIDSYYTPVMTEWLDVSEPNFDTIDEVLFQRLLPKVKRIPTWKEEDLKMKFISPVLELGQVMEGDKFVSYFDKSLADEVEGYKLTVKADFVVAKGVLEYMQKPYFHFQEYKPQKNPTGDPMAQLLEAFLIALQQNRREGKEIPLYGCEIVGGLWRFVTMEGKTYCVSKNYDCSDIDDLKQIIAILRKFREILETRLLD